ncbi:MAG: 1-(5-phosphoribosyl)-5-amino-4-imidazole-carboxylate carboxylase, partial [Oscillibacter sp.]|nr:1-(5-phosphoribosyl)-5-amino-4-imidazole-carboxylate carboxylase [Oscillibacter sp.]
METHEILERVRQGTLSVEEAEGYFRRKPIEDLGFARLDTHRQTRSGFPEVVFCAGKADEHLLRIFQALYEEHREVLGTRASAEQARLVREALPQAEYDPISRILKIQRSDKIRTGSVCVCTAGTADIPVGEEAAQ